MPTNREAAAVLRWPLLTVYGANFLKKYQKHIDKLAETNYINTCELAIANHTGHFLGC